MRLALPAPGKGTVLLISGFVGFTFICILFLAGPSSEACSLCFREIVYVNSSFVRAMFDQSERMDVPNKESGLLRGCGCLRAVDVLGSRERDRVR